MSQGIKQFFLCVLIALSVFSVAASAEGIKLKSADLERVDGDWLLNATFQIELTPGLEDAVQKHPELEEAWSNGIDTMKYSPKLNVHDDNGENYTEMDLWIPISPVKVETNWNPLTDFVKKTYA